MVRYTYFISLGHMEMHVFFKIFVHPYVVFVNVRIMHGFFLLLI